MADEQPIPEKPAPIPVAWGPDHEIVFANSFGVRIGDADMLIDLGTLQNFGNGPVILSSHQLALTLRAAKLLGVMITRAIEELEDRIGEIPIDPQKFESLLTSLADQAAAIKVLSAKRGIEQK